MESIPGYDDWKTTPPDDPEPASVCDCCGCEVYEGDYIYTIDGERLCEGDIFPREGGDVSEERIKELAGSDNKQHTPLIELVEEDPDNTADTDTAEKPPKAGKKRSENKVPENKEPAE